MAGSGASWRRTTKGSDIWNNKLLLCCIIHCHITQMYAWAKTQLKACAYLTLKQPLKCQWTLASECQWSASNRWQSRRGRELSAVATEKASGSVFGVNKIPYYSWMKALQHVFFSLPFRKTNQRRERGRAVWLLYIKHEKVSEFVVLQPLELCYSRSRSLQCKETISCPSTFCKCLSLCVHAHFLCHL